MITMAILETLGIASILPFMSVLTNPDILETNSFLNNLFKASSFIGVKDSQQFLLILGLSVFIILVVSIIFKAITIYFQIRFALMREYSIGKRLIEGYLHQPYSWFLNQNSSDLGKNILSEVSTVVGKGIKPLLELIAKSIITIAIITLLIVANPKLAILVAFCFGGAYAIVFYFIRNYLDKIGKERLKNNQIRFITISEAFNAAKEVKVGGLEEFYIKKFIKSAKKLALTQASATLVSQVPRFVLEAISFGGILLVILYMISKSGSFNASLPILSLYVFAGYRLLPAMQQIYVTFTLLTFAGPSIDKLYYDIKNIKYFENSQEQKKILLNKKISLKNIHYNYPNSSRKALDDVSITIPIGSIIGLVGTTGSGKTTTADIILGLLEAQKGTLEIDESIINKNNLRSWQNTIGYVPQNIYLSDDTIAANIAFGVETQDINFLKLEKVSKIANLHNFIVDELPKKYQTIIGDRGVRLSGGQRQRIGIARALYHDPQVLILDEATSSLDNQTESVIMNSVNNLSDKTIIIIAHRLSTVKKCNKIFLFKKGKIKNQGTFDELIKIDENFRISANS